jgi:hypothetical protein
VIPTSPSGPLGVGVRSGSRKRNAATASVLAGGGTRSDRQRIVHAPAASCYVASGCAMCDQRADLPHITAWLSSWQGP